MHPNSRKALEIAAKQHHMNKTTRYARNKYKWESVFFTRTHFNRCYIYNNHVVLYISKGSQIIQNKRIVFCRRSSSGSRRRSLQSEPMMRKCPMVTKKTRTKLKKRTKMNWLISGAKVCTREMSFTLLLNCKKSQTLFQSIISALKFGDSLLL